MRRIVATCARISRSGRFEALTLAVIVANAVVLGLETYAGVERRHGELLDTLNDAFLAYFVVEILIRLVATGPRPRAFFGNGWNAFDFFVVAAAFVPGVRENATVLRLVRLLRVFRLVSLLPEMRVLVSGLVRSLAPLASVDLLMLLLFYVYGMVGWILFADDDPENWRSIGQAMLTLFEVLTLEEWVEVQRRALEETGWAWVYFVSFVLLSSFLLLNMVIAVVINSVEEARSRALADLAQEERDSLMREDMGRALLLNRLEELRNGIDELVVELSRAGPDGGASARDRTS